LLVVAFWLAIHWPHHSLWYDETLTTWVASGPFERMIRWTTEVDIQVPLHYLVLRGWMGLFGSSEFALHLLSAFCALLAVAGIIALARQLTGNTTAGAVAGLVLGSSPGFLWIAYEVRAYALALALFAWASVVLVRLVGQTSPPDPLSKLWRGGGQHELPHLPAPSPNSERGSKSDKNFPAWTLFNRTHTGEVWLSAAYGLLMLATLYTHYTGLGALAAHVAIIAWIAWRNRSLAVVKRLILAAVIVGVGFAPWLPILLSRGVADRSYFAGTILPDQTLATILSFKWLARDDFKWIGPLAPFVIGGLVVLIVGIALWIGRQQTAFPVVFGLLVTLLPAAMIAVVVYFKPKLAGRYAWPAWIGLDLLMALAVVGLWQTSPPDPLSKLWRGGNPGRAFVTIFFAAILIALPWLSGEIGHPPQSDFRGAFAYIRERWQPGDLLILRDGTLYPAAEYYRSNQPYVGLPAAEMTDATHMLHADEAVSVLAEQSDSIQGVWVLAWQGEVMDPEAVTPGLLETLATREIEQVMFGDVSVDYFRLKRPLSTLQAPQIGPDPLAMLPEGVVLQASSLITPGPLHPGDTIIGHTWWWRRGPVSSDARVSIRLIDSAGQTIGQKDQPPVGWLYFPDRWPANTLILGRYDMQIPANAAGNVSMTAVIYSAANDVTPIVVTIGTVQVNPRQK
jgi:hypothetical protein